MLKLQALTPEALAGAVEGVSLDEARRIVGAIHRHDRLPAAVRNVRASALERVRRAGALPELKVAAVRHSRIDPFIKFSLETGTGDLIETVLIPLERAGRFSVCVSSQAGCALGCVFCATGRTGPGRNLDAWEIIEQVRVARRHLDRARRERVHGIVFQGMGEPLANLGAVLEAIRVASEPSGPAVDGKAITVCTAGLPAGIRRLAREAPKARLAISIGSTRPEVREQLMPISRAWPLAAVLEAAAEHARTTRNAPMWAIALLEGVNDSEEEARETARLARDFQLRSGRRPRISLVPYNPIDAEEPHSFRRSSPERETAFRRVLGDAGLPSHRRYSGGSDIAAACGQLAARALPSPVLDADPQNAALPEPPAN